MNHFKLNIFQFFNGNNTMKTTIATLVLASIALPLFAAQQTAETSVPSLSVKRNLVASGASNVSGPYLISSGRLGTLVPAVAF